MLISSSYPAVILALQIVSEMLLVKCLLLTSVKPQAVDSDKKVKLTENRRDFFESFVKMDRVYTFGAVAFLVISTSCCPCCALHQRQLSRSAPSAAIEFSPKYICYWKGLTAWLSWVSNVSPLVHPMASYITILYSLILIINMSMQRKGVARGFPDVNRGCAPKWKKNR